MKIEDFKKLWHTDPNKLGRPLVEMCGALIIPPHFIKNQSILNIGSGFSDIRGGLLPSMHPKRITAIDKYINATLNHPNDEFIPETDYFDYVFNKGSFDIVLASNSLPIYIPNDYGKDGIDFMVLSSILYAKANGRIHVSPFRGIEPDFELTGIPLSYVSNEMLNNYGFGLSKHLNDLMPSKYIEGQQFVEEATSEREGIYFHPNIHEGEIIQLDKMIMVLPDDEKKSEIDNHIVNNLLPKIKHPRLKKTAEKLSNQFSMN